MAIELARQAWFVRVRFAEGNPKPFFIDFAVGRNSSEEAISAALSQVEPGYDCEARPMSELSPIEIRSYRLRPNEVRAYGRRIYNAASGRWEWEVSDRTNSLRKPRAPGE